MKKYGFISFISRYILYLIKASGKHGVHSPFVYRLYTSVIMDHRERPGANINQVILNRKQQQEQLRFMHPLPGKGEISTTIQAIAKRDSKSEKYRHLLYRIARFHNVMNGLEIGTSLGFSTLCLALAQPNARWTTLEGVHEIAGLAEEGFKNAGLNNIEIITGNFDDTIPHFLLTSPPLDFVYFDGNHQFEPTMRYFEACLTKRSPDAVFIFDDINWSPDMQRAWKAIQEHPEVVTTIDLYMMGIVFFDKSRTKEHFLLRF